jgi:hypothetical protein
VRVRDTKRQQVSRNEQWKVEMKRKKEKKKKTDSVKEGSKNNTENNGE